MAWSPPVFGGGVVWQDDPSTATALDAANLNAGENLEAAFSVAVGTSVVNYFEGGAPTFAGNPTFTGAPTFPTAASGANTTQPATTAFVRAQQQTVHVEDYIAGAANTAAAIQAAFNAAQATPAGGKVEFLYGKTYALSAGTVPTFAGGTPGSGVGIPLEIALNGATIQLSATVPRPWDPNVTADHQTFTVHIHDGTIDRNNVTGAHHVVLGGWVNIAHPTRVNWLRARVERITTINVPNTGGQVMNVAICNKQPNGGEATQNTILHTLVRDCVFNGGHVGVMVGSNQSAGPTVNVFMDHTKLDHVWHSCGTGGTGVSWANYQLGSQAQGGYNNTITDCYGELSLDVGVETDALDGVTLTRVVIADALHACFYANNYQPPRNPATQHLTYRDCTAIFKTVVPTRSWWQDNQNSNGAGHYTMERCRVEINQATAPNGSSGWFWEFNNIPMRSLTVRDFVGEAQGFTWNSASNSVGNYFARINLTQTGGVTPVVRLQNLTFLISGTQAGAGQFQGTLLRIWGTEVLDIDGVKIGWNITNTGGGSLNGALTGIDIGNVAGSVLRGRIHRFRFQEGLSDAAPVAGIAFGSTTNLTSPLNGFTVEGCDFSQMAGGTEVSFASPGNRLAVRFGRGNIWRVNPPAQLSGFTNVWSSSAWASGTPLQYIGSHDALLSTVAGSGSGLTLVQYSTDGTNYSDLVNQAAGTAPAANVLISNGTWVKQTYTTTAATLKLNPLP